MKIDYHGEDQAIAGTMVHFLIKGATLTNAEYPWRCWGSLCIFAALLAGIGNYLKTEVEAVIIRPPPSPIIDRDGGFVSIDDLQ